MAYLSFGVRWLLWALAGIRRRFRPPPEYVSFLVDEAFPQLAPPSGPFWQRPFLGRPAMTLRDLAAAFAAIAADARVKGVVIHLRPLALSAASAETFRELMADLRQAGKRVVCWSALYTPSTYYVACAADEILIQQAGEVLALGYSTRYLFLADALNRAGLAADVVQITPFKTAFDVLGRSEMSAEARQMAEWLIDAQFGELLQAVGGGRGLDEAGAQALVDGSPYTDLQAVAARAVDNVLGEEELPTYLKGGVAPWRSARNRVGGPAPVPPGRYVAVLRIEGSIVDGRSGRAPRPVPVRVPLLLDDRAGDLTVVQEARRLAASRRVAAVVVWIDSGGGSGSASEAMAAALVKLAERKPVVAAMGQLAASGGYYVATPARRIFAQPGTLTGSIGVINLKLVSGPLLDRLDFHRELISRGEHAAINSSDRPWSEEERRKVRDGIERGYEVFVGRVAEARGKSAQEVDTIAGGRVWTGRQALERGLVDELGGLEKAIAAARELAGLPPEAPARELKPSRRELAPAAPSPPLSYALESARLLGGPGAKLLTPLIPWDEG